MYIAVLCLVRLWEILLTVTFFPGNLPSNLNHIFAPKNLQNLLQKFQLRVFLLVNKLKNKGNSYVFIGRDVTTRGKCFDCFDQYLNFSLRHYKIVSVIYRVLYICNVVSFWEGTRPLVCLSLFAIRCWYFNQLHIFFWYQ